MWKEIGRQLRKAGRDVKPQSNEGGGREGRVGSLSFEKAGGCSWATVGMLPVAGVLWGISL